MKLIFSFLLVTFSWIICNAQSPVGKWKMISHVSSYDGQTFDSHKALLTQRPCAAKLYSETNWKVQGNKISISTLKDFSVGQTYLVSFSGNKMIWKGTDGQGTITFQKL